MSWDVTRNRPDKDSYFMAMLPLIAARSHDVHTKVGCVIVGPDGEIRSTGYNGLCRGVGDQMGRRLERPEKYFWVEHAERNAIYNAARVGVPLKGCTLYVEMMPCMDCARAIVQTGICRVVIDEGKQAKCDQGGRWHEHHSRVRQLMGPYLDAADGVRLELWRAA